MYGALLERFAFASAESTATDSGDTEHGSTMFQPKPASAAAATGCTAKQYLDMFGNSYKWYEVPANNEDAARRSATKWGWGFDQPLSKVHGGTKINSLELSFSGLLTAVERVVQFETDHATRKLTKVARPIDHISVEEKKDIARESMRAAFEHIVYRVILGLQSISETTPPIPGVVLAGGVAANSFLRHMSVTSLHLWLLTNSS